MSSYWEICVSSHWSDLSLLLSPKTRMNRLLSIHQGWILLSVAKKAVAQALPITTHRKIYNKELVLCFIDVKNQCLKGKVQKFVRYFNSLGLLNQSFNIWREKLSISTQKLPTVLRLDHCPFLHWWLSGLEHQEQEISCYETEAVSSNPIWANLKV